ncbi:S-methyl-5'-thioadenosine phosphorylase [bacterium]|nr:S-methyl-5'-thioadenosine phosphorylase [bacterium]
MITDREQPRIGIIGGSGFDHFEGIRELERVELTTPFGSPSDAFDIGELEDREIVFLPRHARGHRLLPTEINYRANIWAMKKLGVKWILAVSAVGSLKKEIQPLDIVLIDQYIDRTNSNRKTTFFGDGIVAHINFSRPTCPELAHLVYEAGQEEGAGSQIHWGGTYINIEGPAFSTRAESHLHKSWGVDVVGMTNMGEAKLAREAEICYAAMAMVTDYDCWMEEEMHPEVSVGMVLENLSKNTALANRILIGAVRRIPLDKTCGCHSALRGAIATKPECIRDSAIQSLELLIGKYLPPKKRPAA